MIARFLAWFRKWVIPESSSVVRTTSRRGSRNPDIPVCLTCLKRHHPRCLSRAEVSTIRLRLSGAYSRSAGIAHPPTEGTTARNTTPGIGGSPGPDSDAPAGPIQHNPGSARIDASSRNQFGMCQYPEYRTNGKRARDPGS